jgi:hypothetical protein
MKRLVEGMNTKYQLDFVIIDAASGVRDSYSIATEVSDEMLMFFRWSAQHVEGTIRMAKLMKLLKDYDQSSTPFKLIACASPQMDELRSLEDETLREGLTQIRKNTVSRIEETLRECGQTPSSVFHEIPELLRLKWRETIIVFGDEVTPYETLAVKLIQA